MLYTGDKQPSEDTEPALRVGVNVAVISGILAVIAFLWPNLLNTTSVFVIMIITAFLLPIITAIFTRGKVWSPASVSEVIEEAEETIIKVIEEEKKNKNA